MPALAANIVWYPSALRASAGANKHLLIVATLFAVAAADFMLKRCTLLDFLIVLQFIQWNLKILMIIKTNSFYWLWYEVMSMLYFGVRITDCGSKNLWYIVEYSRLTELCAIPVKYWILRFSQCAIPVEYWMLCLSLTNRKYINQLVIPFCKFRALVWTVVCYQNIPQ